MQFTNQNILYPPVPNSPSLGPAANTVAQVIVETSDDGFAVLQLSTSAVTVSEQFTGPFINVIRVGGIFARVSVKFDVIPVTASVSKCYTINLNTVLSRCTLHVC